MLKLVSDNRRLSLELGVRNLLFNCAKCVPGQSLLLVHEAENDGYFDPTLVGEISNVASEFGFITESFAVPFEPEVTDPDAGLVAKMAQADCTVFLARLGDQIRFRAQNASKAQIICYALDCEMLSSAFGTTDYTAFEALAGLIDTALAQASEIHVTCPAGTDFIGNAVGFNQTNGDVTRKRFPVSVFAPVPSKTFSGRVAQRGFLTGTGSNYYTPWACELQDTLMVDFEANRITGFDGASKCVAAAKAHYAMVSKKFDIDPYFVHSWHAGIHPGCEYKPAAGTNFERWSGSAFGNPRLLHFHTCGDYPPGEISLNVLDPTISIDGVKLWEHGVLYPERIAGGAQLLSDNPDMAATFRSPATHVGQAACGNLRFS